MTYEGTLPQVQVQRHLQSEAQPLPKIKAKSRWPGMPDLIEGRELECLSQALRLEQRWRRFAWDMQILCSPNYTSVPVAGTFCDFKGCALGLAGVLWFDEGWAGTSNASAKEGFNIPHIDAIQLFVEVDQVGGRLHQLSPIDVADAIDRYLVTGKVSYDGWLDEPSEEIPF